MKMIRIALYQPDIAQNTGTILRLCACLGVEAHIIEPAGFPVSDRAFRRAGLDYLDQVSIVRHVDWQAFEAWRGEARAIAGLRLHRKGANKPAPSRCPAFTGIAAIGPSAAAGPRSCRL